MPFALSSPSLTNLLSRCDFLTLLPSGQAFPGSKGEGLAVLRLDTPVCTAHIALQGAHLLSFCAKDGSPLLWLSPNCEFTPGIALRGGIPVCLPWFGPHPTDATRPKHGFARNRDWQLIDAHILADKSAQLSFRFISKADALFEFNFTAELVMTLGTTIKLAISVINDDNQPFDCSWVLHTYYPVSVLNDVRVQGLAGRTYLDNLEKHAAKQQHGDVSFSGEVDRVFPDIQNSLQITGSPTIKMTHNNCPSVVVWNPGAANAAKIADIGAGNEQNYICVERGAVLDEKWTLAPGESKRAQVVISENN